MYFISTATLADDFIDSSERHELVVGAKVCKQCISRLKQLATVADQYFIFDNARAISGRLKLKKIKMNKIFRRLIAA